MKTILLASASPRRRELLDRLGFPYIVHPADIDESSAIIDPAALVQDLSLRKATAVATLPEIVKEYPDAIVLGSDTVVSLSGEILGKPADPEDAFLMLSRLSGRTHTVFTGVCLAFTDAKTEPITFTDSTDVTFYPLSEEEIRAYIATGEPLDKAGAYGIQGQAFRFIKEIRGDYNTVMGLPAAHLYQVLKDLV